MTRPAVTVTRSRTTAVAMTLLATAVLGAACTARQSDDQYGERLEVAIATREDVRSRVSSDALTSAADLRSAGRDLDEVADDLDVDPPPQAVEQGHERMLDGMEALRVLVQRLATCVSGGAPVGRTVRMCRNRIDQSVFDDIENDFAEADTIFAAEGFEVPGHEEE